MKKLNCWEVKKCGRELNGFKVKELGTCPVALETALNKVHDGVNAGRACWVVAGTFCNDVVQGTFAQKFKNCETCEVYRMVKSEEFPNFKLSSILLKMLKKGK